MTWDRSTASSRRVSSPGWKRLRLEILKRDGYICWLCGGTGADQVDHLRPASLGGTDDPSNLRAAHRDCHLRKSSSEGNAARWRYRTARPAERHPGLLD